MAQEAKTETIERLGRRLATRKNVVHRGYRIPGGAESACWEYSLCKTSGKYGSIVGHESGRRLVISCHRLSAAFYKIKEKDGSDFTLASDTLVLHDCDNKACFRPEHLKCGDKLENIMEAIARGQFVPGPKLDRKTIKLLKKWHKKGLLARASNGLGINYAAALLAVKGITYANNKNSSGVRNQSKKRLVSNSSRATRSAGGNDRGRR